MVYLVDFENVNSAGISGIQKLNKDDKVYIFYTVNASSLSFAAHLNLLSSPAEIIYYNVASGGKNALDFQLSSFLGYLISKGDDKNFCIISNDRGFEYVKGFWERNGLASGITIQGAPSINRSLLPERPFAAKIQQGLSKERIRTDDSDQEEIVQEETVILQNRSTPVSAPRTSLSDSVPETEHTEEDSSEERPARKKRGRPKGNNSRSKNETAPHETPQEDVPLSALKAALVRGEVTAEENELRQIMDLLEKAAGKQHFYRGLLSIFGMEKGVEVYKLLRPEYTNLTKLVKQQ